MRSGHYDLAVIGGGINGLGIARDAAGRGLSVLLCEQHDLAAHTSSASSKLIHGGLRYLEHFELLLVRKALVERALLLKSAAHLVSPLTFVVPVDPAVRPAWMLRLGLFVYDHLAPQAMPASRLIDLRDSALGAALKPEWAQAFEYSDARTDDARLAVTVAIDARERGAVILPRTPCISAARKAGRWRIGLAPEGGRKRAVTARALVDASGPWVGRLARELKLPSAHTPRLVKGSHIVVPRQIETDTALLLQHGDGRIVFVLPFQRDYTLIGTTEAEFAGDPAEASISPAEVDYLLDAVNRYLRRSIARSEVIWAFAGVRPLFDESAITAGAASRDYAFDLDLEGAPLLTVLGGKLTTFRRLAEDALEQLLPALDCKAGPWTAEAILPGSDLPAGGGKALAAELLAQHPWLPASLAERWVGAYGTRTRRLLGEAQALPDLGREVLPGLFEAELRYLVAEEWAACAEDVLWRRSKLGLGLPAESAAIVQAWFTQRAHQTPAANGG